MMDYFTVENYQQAQKLWESQGDRNIDVVRNEQSPFSVACQRGDPGLVMWFLSKAKINRRDHRVPSPLTLAARCGHLEVAKLLVQSDFDVNSESFEETPLNAAVKSGSIPMVNFLIDNGARIDSWGSFGMTPLQTAIQDRKYLMTEILLKRGANPNGYDIDGLEPLSYALLADDGFLIERLLEYGASLVEARENMAEIIVQKRCEPETVDFLRRRGLW